MTVQVGRCPVLEEQLDALLSEHYALCPDNVFQGMKREAFRSSLPERGWKLLVGLGFRR